MHVCDVLQECSDMTPTELFAGKQVAMGLWKVEQHSLSVRTLAVNAGWQPFFLAYRLRREESHTFG